MGPIVLLAGVLLLISGVSALASGEVASHQRLRRHSGAYAWVAVVLGASLVVGGVVLL